ncbi:hypothetical protein BDR03DRAFT_956642 [Suillus americanus]|nr:hypothetical protein BDR03DRAFT_956642 [Suillus americanus]
MRCCNFHGYNKNIYATCCSTCSTRFVYGYCPFIFGPRLYESLCNGRIRKLRVGTFQAANLSLHRSGVSCMIIMI